MALTRTEYEDRIEYVDRSATFVVYKEIPARVVQSFTLNNAILGQRTWEDLTDLLDDATDLYTPDEE
jgi:hypothetical protein